MCPEREIYSAQPGGNCEKKKKKPHAVHIGLRRIPRSARVRGAKLPEYIGLLSDKLIIMVCWKTKKTLQNCEMTTMRVPCWYLTLNHKTDLTFWELNSLTLPPVLQGRSGQMTIPRSARLPLSIGHLLESECPYHGKSQKNTPRISLMTVIMTTMLAPNPKPQYRLDLGSSIPVRS